MECLRKGEEKSENRRSIIVEAGALAVAANVEHLSLTSKNNIASIEQVRCEEFPSSKITNMTSPVYIQDKWNRSFVLMILLATSGLVVWNGVKWTAKIRKGQVEKRLHDEFMSELKGLELKGLELEGGKWYKEFQDTHLNKCKEYLSATDNRKKMALLQEWIKWMLNSFKNIRKNVEKVKSSFQPWFFVWSLSTIYGVVTLVKEVDKALTDEKCLTDEKASVKAIIEAINEYQQGFLNKSPKFLSDYPALKSTYDSLMSDLSNNYHQLSNPSIVSVLESSETISDT